MNTFSWLTKKMKLLVWPFFEKKMNLGTQTGVKLSVKFRLIKICSCSVGPTKVKPVPDFTLQPTE